MTTSNEMYEKETIFKNLSEFYFKLYFSFSETIKILLPFLKRLYIFLHIFVRASVSWPVATPLFISLNYDFLGIRSHSRSWHSKRARYQLGH